MTAQVVETLVNVNNNSSIQDYVYSDDETQPTFEMTPGFKPFTWWLVVEKNTVEPFGTDTSLIRTPTDSFQCPEK